MRLKSLLADEDAVSPVIGVILMVAITVILAAVIASVVLGVGQQAGNVAPQASFTFEYDSSAGTGSWDGGLTVEYESGDSIVVGELFLRGQGFAQSSTNQSWAGYAGDGDATTSGSVGGEDAVVAGDRADILADSDYEIAVVWESSEGDTSSTLTSDDGPDA